MRVCRGGMVVVVAGLALSAAAPSAMAQCLWAPIPTLGPEARTYHAMAYSTAAATGVMYGGYTAAGTVLDDTWVWNGTLWTRVMTAHTPFPRRGHGMANDSLNSRVVLFGGENEGLNDTTYLFNGSDWIAQQTSTVPAARAGLAMVYDSARQRVTMFGGSTAFVDFNDTWVWTGTDWLLAAAGGAGAPPARLHHAMAFDSLRQRVVMYGGRTRTFQFFDDTWEWDGASWTRVMVPGPSERQNAAMAFDPFRGRCVLMGGERNLVPLGDVWEYNGTAWSPGTVGPPARYGGAMVYRTANSTLYLFGGRGVNTSLGDTWAMTCATPPVCYANCDASTIAPVLNVMDFTCFLNMYSAGFSYANCDASTIPPVLNVSDFICYLNRFGAGCG